jgi:3-deoxy-7-phosphoheptulonate synthase
MVIVMQPGAGEEQIQKVIERLVEKGFDVHRSTGAERTVLGAIGNKNGIDIRDFEILDGVHEVLRISEPYKLAGRTFQREDSQISVNGVTIGGPEIVVMAGPCSVESRQQIKTIAKLVKEAGAKVLRGGAFKPRTSPYSFQGLGEEGLKYLREAADANGLLTVSEIMDRMDIPIAIRYIDIIQIGARNMQNFTLLKELGNLNKPILLKRGMAATIEELLMAAEYIMSGGNRQVILCERGIRTFENSTRNTLDISAIPVVKKKSHLPIIADPSHGTGLRDHVAPMARAAIAAGSDGLLIEVHHEPDKALSDGAQSLFPEQFADLMKDLAIMAQAIGRKI